MSSNFYSVYSFFWIGLQLVQIVLCLWIAIIVFRQRSPAAWIAISGAISMSIFAIATRVVVATAASWGIGSVRSTGMPSYIQISQALSIAQGVAMMTFLGWHAAQLILGRTNRRAFFADIPFPAVPEPVGRSWFVPLASAAYHLGDFAANPGEVVAERLGRPGHSLTTSKEN